MSEPEVRGGAVAVASDWDSLICQSEPVLAGFAAGSYTEGSTAGAGAPSPDDVAAFLAEYDGWRSVPFTRSQQRAAAAAATRILAYNARCGVSALVAPEPSPDGSAFNVLTRHREADLRLRW